MSRIIALLFGTFFVLGALMCFQTGLMTSGFSWFWIGGLISLSVGLLFFRLFRKWRH